MDQGPKSYWAEFLGTFVLCFIGQGAIVINQVTGGQPGLLGIAIAHGLALAVMVSTLGATSGGHFNPAVTFGFVVTGRQSMTSAITYWISQIMGAVVASFLLRAVMPGDAGDLVHYGAPVVAVGTGISQALLIEVILTFFLVTSVWGTAVDDQAEGQYWVINGQHYNSGCCFDYGNAEIDSRDDGNGTMETTYYGNATAWYRGPAPGPWIMTDQENNLVGCVNSRAGEDYFSVDEEKK